jgi:acyl-CoA thioesterase FadM
MGAKSVTYEFHFRRDHQPLATGRMTVVCCRLDPEGPLQSIPIPEWIAEKLRPLIDG